MCRFSPVLLNSNYSNNFTLCVNCQELCTVNNGPLFKTYCSSESVKMFIIIELQ